MELPKDPMMLFSFINTKLRDCYSSLDELCDDMNVNKETLIGSRPDLNIVQSITSSGDFR
mgnify:CR=1 FL=1